MYGDVRGPFSSASTCRLEAQYANQRQPPMIPLLVEEGYRANRWLEIMMGVETWYAFYGSVLLDKAFESKVDELCRDLGNRGKSAEAMRILQSAVDAWHGPPTSVVPRIAATATTQNGTRHS